MSGSGLAASKSLLPANAMSPVERDAHEGDADQQPDGSTRQRPAHLHAEQSTEGDHAGTSS